MTGSLVRLFIERRWVPLDGSRRAVADGHVERQDTAGLKADEALLSDLAEAMSEQQGGAS